MPEGELEGSLLSVIGSAGGKDLLQDAAEFSLDAFLDDGVVKDIPVVGVVAKLYGVAARVQGYVFTKKVRRFLTELTAIPQAEREKFAERLERDPKQREKTADALIVLLDKLDDLAKARTPRRPTRFPLWACFFSKSWFGARAAGSDPDRQGRRKGAAMGPITLFDKSFLQSQSLLSELRGGQA